MYTVKRQVQEQKYDQAVKDKLYQEELSNEIEKKLTKIKKDAERNKVKS